MLSAPWTSHGFVPSEKIPEPKTAEGPFALSSLIAPVLGYQLLGMGARCSLGPDTALGQATMWKDHAQVSEVIPVNWEPPSIFSMMSGTSSSSGCFRIPDEAIDEMYSKGAHEKAQIDDDVRYDSYM